MVDGKKDSKKEVKKTRAKLTHKLAKYVRARPINLGLGLRPDAPSVTHLTTGGPQRKSIKNNSNTWYPADDEKKHFKRARLAPKPSSRTASFAPGTVAILLSGKHRGRRVVVLKSLPSGNLLITGPSKINGVPLKRVNPAFVIRTSTVVPLTGVNAAAIDDKWFTSKKTHSTYELKRASQGRKNKISEGEKAHDAAWKTKSREAQKTIDTALLANIGKVEQLKGYLGTRFTLYNGTRPHELKF